MAEYCDTILTLYPNGTGCIQGIPIANILGGGQACAGRDIYMLSQDQQAGYTYYWTGPNGFTSTDPFVYFAGVNVNGSYTGTYTLTVTNAEGCSATTSTEVVVYTPGSIIVVGYTLSTGIGNYDGQIILAFPGGTWPKSVDFFRDDYSQGFSDYLVDPTLWTINSVDINSGENWLINMTDANGCQILNQTYTIP